MFLRYDLYSKCEISITLSTLFIPDIKWRSGSVKENYLITALKLRTGKIKIFFYFIFN